jgi:hypothetical protein
MLKSVLYKEWLKTRWFLIIFLIAGTLATGYVFLKVKYDFTFKDATNYWYMILFQNLLYFRFLEFVPLSGAVAVAIAQYFPETINKRIKLTFHLPVNEDKVLLVMMLYGTVCLLAAYLVIFGLFLTLSSVYFPSGIIWKAVGSVLPWFLAGFATSYLIALIILEPVWLYRFVYLLVTAAFVPVFFETSVAGGYAPANPVLLIFVLILSIALLFSGYRFRKGEM